MADPTLVPSAVEEGLAHGSVIQAVFRSAAREAVVAGETIPAGARVMLLFASANRDGRRWPDAASFDVGRYADGLGSAGAHLAFGAGPHSCPGAQLARRIGRAVLAELLDAGARLAPAGPSVCTRNPSFRSFISLPIQVHTRSTA